MIVELSEGHGRRTHHLQAECAVRAPIWLGDNRAGWVCVAGVWRKLRLAGYLLPGILSANKLAQFIPAPCVAYPPH